MEAFSYTLRDCWELTLPEVRVHLSKFHEQVSEPDWFVKAWRKAKSPRAKLEALREFMR